MFNTDFLLSQQVSELVHQAHLLCLLGRGRLVDSACNDPLIQVIGFSPLQSFRLALFWHGIELMFQCYKI